MRQGRTRGRRAVTGLATLLVVLLALHHPLMGYMPMDGTASQSMAAPGGAISSDMSMLVPPATACPGCAMTCPLMDGIMPDRSAHVSSPKTPHGASGVSGAAAQVPLHASYLYRRTRGAGTSGYAPSSRRRRAILRVYLL